MPVDKQKWTTAYARNTLSGASRGELYSCFFDLPDTHDDVPRSVGLFQLSKCELSSCDLVTNASFADSLRIHKYVTGESAGNLFLAAFSSNAFAAPVAHHRQQLGSVLHDVYDEMSSPRRVQSGGGAGPEDRSPLWDLWHLSCHILSSAE